MAAAMPVYEYACKSCGHHLEVSQSFKDPPLTECPVCSGPLRKVFNSIGIVLKGSGFYRTDSRLPAKKGGDKAERAEKADKSDSKSESKSDAAGGKPSSSSGSGSSSSGSSSSGSSGSSSGSGSSSSSSSSSDGSAAKSA